MERSRFKMKFCGILALLSIFSCANITMLTGGAKDITPPVIEKMNPANKSTHFKGNEVSIRFDEFVELETPQKNIVVSPYTAQKIEYSISGKTVYLYFPEGLKQQTTYSLQLNNAIKDYTEGNFLPKTEWLFSTGDRLDSGQFSAVFVDCKTKKVNDQALVCLVKNKEDFLNKKYNYVAKINQGVAQFNNLNNDKYWVYAFVDSNSNMTWDKTEPIGFVAEKITAINWNGVPQKIGGFISEPQKIESNLVPISKNEYELSFNTEVSHVQLLDTNFILYSLSEKTYRLIAKQVVENQTLRINYNFDRYETLKLPIVNSRKYLAMIEKNSRNGNRIYRNDTVRLPFNSYISKIDLKKIKITNENDTLNIPIQTYKNQLIITGLDFGKNYILQLDSQAVQYLESYNKPIQYAITTCPVTDYFSEIKVKLDAEITSNPKSMVYYNNNEQWIFVEKKPEINLVNVYGNELKFKIIFDENQNKRWDTGNIEKETQPEPYFEETLTLDSKQKEYILKLKK